jgi:hypothetical protein
LKEWLIYKNKNKMYARAIDIKPLNMRITSSNTGSSYDPDVFGPALWFSLHNTATTYPDYPDFTTKSKMKNFLINLDLLIPCQLCKTHWNENLKKYNLDVVVNSRENLFSFFVFAHNHVNFMSNKSQMTVETAKNIYGFYRPGFGSSIRISYD